MQVLLSPLRANQRPAVGPAQPANGAAVQQSPRPPPASDDDAAAGLVKGSARDEVAGMEDAAVI